MKKYIYSNSTDDEARQISEYYDISQIVTNGINSINLYEHSFISRLEYLVKIIKHLHLIKIRNIVDINNAEYIVRRITPIKYFIKNSSTGYDSDILFIRSYLVEYLRTGQFIGLDVNDNFNITFIGDVMGFRSIVESYFNTIEGFTARDIIRLLNAEFDDEKYY